MAHIIGDIAVMPRIAKRTQMLSCIGEAKQQICKKDIYDAHAIQQRINKAAEVRRNLENENREKDERLKNINFIG